MSKTNVLKRVYDNFFSLILGYNRIIDKLIIKSDKDNIKILLENDRDRNEYEKAIDELSKGNTKTKHIITSKGKEIVISV